MIKIFKKLKIFLISIVVLLLMYFVSKEMAERAMNMTIYSFKEMVLVLPPIFILLGLLDVWVHKDVMITHMGPESGIRGIILAFFLGSAAAGPLYGAFPVAAILMKKGARFRNVLIFIGAWSTTKIPMFLFEMASLGKTFAITRLLVDIPGIIIIAWIIEKIMNKDEIEDIYNKVSIM